jgi:hypothetical protein
MLVGLCGLVLIDEAAEDGPSLDPSVGDSTDIINNPTSAQSFHPTIGGTTLYADTANRAFALLGM